MLSATLLHMQQPESSREPPQSSFTARTSKQARLLLGPAYITHLIPFWGQDRTIGQAAAELQLPLNSVHYRVTKLHKAGLLTITATTKRAGRPIRHYRTTADRFIIPDQLRTSDDEHRLTAELLPIVKSIISGLTRRNAPDSTGRLLYLDEHRRLHSDSCKLTSDTDRQPTASTEKVGAVQYGHVPLSPAAAQAFQAELKELVNRYTQTEAEASSAGRHEYSFITAIAPAAPR